MKGNCYVTSEAVYHLTGGLSGPYKPETIRLLVDGKPVVHWYLRHKETGQVLDLTVSQFNWPPSYAAGRGRGFLTKKPSKRAAALMQRLVYQDRETR